MVICIVPTTVFAEDARYGVWILGEEITSSRKISQKEGWEFDPNTYTLNLRNFQMGTIVNARTTDIIKGQAAVSTRGKLYVGERSRLITCSVAKSSSWERVGFFHNLPDTNYISSLYVAGVATVDGGLITAYFYKRKGSYINEYDYSIEDYGETKAFYCKRLDIDNGGEVNVFFDRAEGKDPQNEYGFDTSDTANSWEDLMRGCIYFRGDGVMRVGTHHLWRKQHL